MSDELPTPDAGTPPAQSRVVNSNRRQVLLFVALTLILTVATVWGGRTWVRNSETLIFAVGDANSLDARFAAKLAVVLKNSSSRLRLKIVPNVDSAKALAQFDRRQADLAVLRTDAKIPPRARALAILEHDVLLLISPGGKKIKSLAEKKEDRDADNTSRSCAPSSRFPITRMAVHGCIWRRRIRQSNGCSRPVATARRSPLRMPRRSSRTRAMNSLPGAASSP